MKTNRGLYIHIPFCERKCFYCSFVVAVNQLHRADEYCGGIHREAQQYSNEAVSTVYFGGGTPSILSDRHLKALVSSLRDNFRIDPAGEWTIECNPESIDSNKAKVIKQLGFNRVSLGIQSFNDRFLKSLGRNHDYTVAVAAFDTLRDAGHNNINIDLLYLLPGQTDADLSQDLREVIALDAEHISMYSLTVEPKSRFFVSKVSLPDGENQARYYCRVQDYLGTHGFEHYEVSNFARPQRKSCHNLNYWQGGNYWGLGVGAHSHCNGHRWWNVSTVPAYTERMINQQTAQEGEEILSAQQRLRERIVFGLRMIDGIDIDQCEGEIGASLCDETQRSIEELIKQGFLEIDAGHLKTTRTGILVLDDLSARLI